MSFSSIPTYLDPSNWQQQPNSQNGGMGAIPNQQNEQFYSLAKPAPPPPPAEQLHAVGGCTEVPVRPGSMSERARLANIPVPEAGLKCPRCESTNTKFCYFNNYNLSQPRHFCKTCRRYWTRGGGLRTVPVGGGCRRNKRSKNTSSKPSISQTTSSSTSTISSSSNGGPPRLVSSIGPVADRYGTNGVGFSYTSLPLVDMNSINQETVSVIPSDSLGHGGTANGIPSDSLEQWRLQQYPFWGGLDPSLGNGLYRFQVGETSGDQMREKPLSSMLTQLESMKMEENQGILLRRNFMGISCNDSWPGAAYMG